MNNIKLHSSIELLQIGPQQLQLRVPDGEHITLDTKKIDLSNFFTTLKRGASREALLAQFPENQHAGVDGLLAMLQERGFIHKQNDYFGSADFVTNMFDYYVQKSRQHQETDANRQRKTVYVCGDGLIANTARSTLAKLSLLASKRELADLVLVCSDHSDFDFMLEQNQQAIQESQTTSFIFRFDTRLIVGPLVYPKESACFHCFSERLKSNTFFIHEFESCVQQKSIEPLTDQSEIFTGLLQYFISHHAISVLFNLTDVVKPNEIAEFSLTNAMTKKSPILKLPRCEVCGRRGHGSLQRAVRDLL